MVLPSQAGQSGYRRNNMYRSKQGSFRLLIGGILLVAVVVIIWIIVARAESGANGPPAVVTNAPDVSDTIKNAEPDGAKREAQQPRTATQPNRANTDSAPRLVMGEHVPTTGDSQTSAVRTDSTRSTGSSNQPATQLRTSPPAMSAASQSAPSTPANDQRPAASPAGTPTTDTPATTPPRAVSHAQRLLEDGLKQSAAGRLIEARQTLSMALEQLDPASRDAAMAREHLGEINNVLVFSEKVAPNDRFARTHKIQSGELLSTIAKPLGVDWRFIARLNNIKDPGRIQAGQNIKVIDGTFHAIVRKSAYELDLYLGEGSDRVFVRSFRVGLGELDSTPVGRFTVLSRVANPSWKNPRTGEYFGPDDPKNPIGEYWIGFKGIEPKTEGMIGYGLHGTIEPESIGKQLSMGCVRMLDEDISLVYELLTSSRNTIEIVP